MMNNNSNKIAGAAVNGGITGGTITAAGSILSGAAMGTASVTSPLWGWVPFGIGATTVIAPVLLPFALAGFAIAGAVIGATVAGGAERNKIQKTEDEWNRYTQK